MKASDALWDIRASLSDEFQNQNSAEDPATAQLLRSYRVESDHCLGGEEQTMADARFLRAIAQHTRRKVWSGTEVVDADMVYADAVCTIGLLPTLAQREIVAWSDGVVECGGWEEAKPAYPADPNVKFSLSRAVKSWLKVHK